MSSGTALFHIDAVDAFARNLHIRAQTSSSVSLKSILLPLRNLHLALRHLRIEAADRDSLLNSASQDAALYNRQLKPLVEDCEYTLKQLEAFLDKFENEIGSNGTSEDEGQMARVEAVRTTLVNDKTKIDLFLDTVQLQNSKRDQTSMSAAHDGSLEGIKDKVDAVATKVFQTRDENTCGENDEENHWQDFKSELEKEGFSPQVLQKHKVRNHHCPRPFRICIMYDKQAN